MASKTVMKVAHSTFNQVKMTAVNYPSHDYEDKTQVHSQYLKYDITVYICKKNSSNSNVDVEQ